MSSAPIGRSFPAATPRRRLGVIVRQVPAYLFLLPALVIYALFAWYPIVKGFVLSFQQVNLVSPAVG